MNKTSDTTAAADERIDFLAVYYSLREKAWILGACAAIGALLGLGYLLRAPKIYSAQTIVEVEDAPVKVLNIQTISNDSLGSAELLKTIEQNLNSPELLKRIIASQRFDAAALGLPARPDKPYTENELIRALGSLISAKVIYGTRLIAVTAENRSASVAQKISLAVVEEYGRMNMEQRLGIVSEANNFLSAEAKRLKEKLQKSEQALQDYKEQTQAVSLQESQNITVEKLKELNAKLTAAKGERLKLEADYAQAQKLGEDKAEVLLTLPSVADSKTVVEQKKIVAEQEGVVANLGKRYGPLHPKLIQAKSQLDAQRAELGRVISAAAASIGSSYVAAKDTEEKLQEALQEQEQKALELNKLAIPYNVLQREVESDRALYDSVLNKMKETDVMKSVQQGDVFIKSPALVPDRPAKPRRWLILGASTFFGLLTGAGIILAIRTFDRSLRTVEEAERFLAMSAIAVIPEAKRNGLLASEFVMLEEPGSATAEGFRTMRTSLSLMHPKRKWKSVAITSALPDEGKTFCAINYAIACAQEGSRTLLIDCDLRLRSLTKIFFSEGTRHGLSDLITGESILDVCIKRTNTDNLFVLTAGARVPNPLEVLSGTSFAEIVEEAKTNFDRIVVDTAPVTPVSDAFLLMRSVDYVCPVIAASRTSREVVARSLQKITDAGGQPLGFILNRVPAIPALAGYYGYNSRSYGDGVYPSESDIEISTGNGARPVAHGRLD